LPTIQIGLEAHGSPFSKCPHLGEGDLSRNLGRPPSTANGHYCHQSVTRVNEFLGIPPDDLDGVRDLVEPGTHALVTVVMLRIRKPAGHRDEFDVPV
jgi:hypothetical protein